MLKASEREGKKSDKRSRRERVCAKCLRTDGEKERERDEGVCRQKMNERQEGDLGQDVSFFLRVSHRVRDSDCGGERHAAMA